MAEQEPIAMELQVPEAMTRGVYSDVMSVSVGAHEVTLDFIDTEPHPSAPEDHHKRGYLVARVIRTKSQLRPIVELLEGQLKTVEAGETDAAKQ